MTDPGAYARHSILRISKQDAKSLCDLLLPSYLTMVTKTILSVLSVCKVALLKWKGQQEDFIPLLK